MSRTGFRCKIQALPEVHPAFSLILRPGYTSLVGPNGAGKTALLQEIWRIAGKRGYKTFCFSGSGSVQFFLEQFLCGNAEQEPTFILLNDPDIGLSADRLQTVMDSIEKLERKAGVCPGGAQHELYIIAAVNNYAMAKRVCVDVRTGESRVFGGYEEYERFICGYFQNRFL